MNKNHKTTSIPRVISIKDNKTEVVLAIRELLKVYSKIEEYEKTAGSMTLELINEAQLDLDACKALSIPAIFNIKLQKRQMWFIHQAYEKYFKAVLLCEILPSIYLIKKYVDMAIKNSEVMDSVIRTFNGNLNIADGSDHKILMKKTLKMIKSALSEVTLKEEQIEDIISKDKSKLNVFLKTIGHDVNPWLDYVNSLSQKLYNKGRGSGLKSLFTYWHGGKAIYRYNQLGECMKDSCIKFACLKKYYKPLMQMAEDDSFGTEMLFAASLAKLIKDLNRYENVPRYSTQFDISIYEELKYKNVAINILYKRLKTAKRGIHKYENEISEIIVKGSALDVSDK
jgi:hypothetical protein